MMKLLEMSLELVRPNQNSDKLVQATQPRTRKHILPIDHNNKILHRLKLPIILN